MPDNREWQEAWNDLWLKEDPRALATLLRGGDAPPVIQRRLAELLEAPAEAIRCLQLKVNRRQLGKFKTFFESITNGVELDLAAAGPKRYAGVHALEDKGKGRAKLYNDRNNLTLFATELKSLLEACTPEEREKFQRGYESGDLAIIPIFEKVWLSLRDRGKLID